MKEAQVATRATCFVSEELAVQRPGRCLHRHCVLAQCCAQVQMCYQNCKQWTAPRVYGGSLKFM